MSVTAKYCWYVRSPTTCTRYGESWHPQYYRCLEACGGLFAVRESNGAYNTVCVREVMERCSCRRTRYGPWYHGLTCALPSPFAPGPFRAGVPGRMAPVGPGRASRRRAASRLPTGPRSESRGRSRKQRFGPGLSNRRDCPEAAGAQSECSGRRGGPKKL